jgi:hypothetical protein
MSQRGTTAMMLCFLASLVVFVDTIYRYSQGRGLEWRGIVIGVALVGAGVYFKTVQRPT